MCTLCAGDGVTIFHRWCYSMYVLRVGWHDFRRPLGALNYNYTRCPNQNDDGHCCEGGSRAFFWHPQPVGSRASQVCYEDPMHTNDSCCCLLSLSRPDGGIGPIEKYAYHPTAYSAHTSKSTTVPVPLPLIGVHSQCYVVVVNLDTYEQWT